MKLPQNGLKNTLINSLPVSSVPMSQQKTPPTFFTSLDQFLSSLPDTPEKTTTDASLLASYNNHYSMDLVGAGIARHHAIWKTEINTFRIVQQRWQATSRNGKVLIIVHGYFDHSALYGKLIRWGLAQGYDIHAFDLPGHGLSSGRPAAIEHFDEYSEVLSTIIQKEGYRQYSLIGQSTGCAVIINSLLNKSLSSRLEPTPEHVILLAPLVRPFYWQRLRWLYRLLSVAIKSVKRLFVKSSHDDVFNHFLEKNDPLQTRKIPLCWLGAMDKWITTIQQFAPVDTIPTTIIQGTKDVTVDWHYNHPQIKRCLPQTNIHFVEQACHHLVNESDPYWQGVISCLHRAESL